MARILFISPYFPPEVGAAQARISETAMRLARRGHEVTVLTTLPNYPKGAVFPGYEGGQRRREVWNGVRIVRVWSYISPNKGFLRRILAQLSFGALAPFLGFNAIGQPDVIIVESPPLFDAFAGRALAWLKRCPYIFTVADIWPESAVQLGALKNRALIWLAERLEWSTYLRAALVWTVTEGIRATLVARGLPEARVFRLTNGVDTTAFRGIARNEARAHLDWDGRFTVLYAGTIGLAQGLEIVLDTAERLRDVLDVRFVLAGEGAAKDSLKVEALRRGLTSVEFLDAYPHAQMPVVLSAADACLVSLKKVPLFEGAIPSKLYEAMACAKPILLAVDGEARDLVERDAGAAVHVRPEDGNSLADGVMWLRSHPDEARGLGARGRAFVVERFDRESLTTALEGYIASAIAGHRGVAGGSQSQSRASRAPSLSKSGDLEGVGPDLPAPRVTEKRESTPVPTVSRDVGDI
jgi:putative colanic acid biosynthesis glycosyltransferase WcaI